MKYQVSPEFAKLIGMTPNGPGGKYIYDRVKVQESFIQYAIKKGFVSEDSHVYDLSKEDFLMKELKVQNIHPKMLFSYLCKFLTK